MVPGEVVDGASSTIHERGHAIGLLSVAVFTLLACWAADHVAMATLWDKTPPGAFIHGHDRLPFH